MGEVLLGLEYEVGEGCDALGWRNRIILSPRRFTLTSCVLWLDIVPAMDTGVVVEGCKGAEHGGGGDGTCVCTWEG